MQNAMRQFLQPDSQITNSLDRMADIDLHSICANLIDIAKEAGRIVVSAHPDSSTTSNKKNGSYIPVRLQRTNS